MAVTVLVPVYNAERYIAACATSLFEQSYADIDYVFCDDGSTDGSMAVLRQQLLRYPQRAARTRILLNGRNRGSGFTRRRLLQAVATDMVCTADADDLMLPRGIELMVRRMQETGSNMVEGAFYHYTHGRRHTLHAPLHVTDDKYARRVLCLNYVAHCVWAKLFTTELLRSVPDLFVEGVDMSEDMAALCRLVHTVRRAWVDEVVYLQRVENQSTFIDKLSTRNALSMFKASQLVAQYYSRLGRVPLAVEIGLLESYRVCHKSHVKVETVDSCLSYAAWSRLARCLRAGLRSRHALVYRVTDYLYRLTRAIVAR